VELGITYLLWVDCLIRGLVLVLGRGFCIAICMGIRIITAGEEHLMLRIPRLSNVYVQFVGILEEIFALENCNLNIYFLGISLFLPWICDRLVVFHLVPFLCRDTDYTTIDVIFSLSCTFTKQVPPQQYCHI
jgi:hypothetical protein